MDQDQVTRRFAEALAHWSADETAVLDAARLLLIDGIAVAVAGAREEGPSRIAAMTRREASAPVATVIGHGFAASAALAARANGVAMHVLDYEPMWNPPNHAISPMLPALLAIAERAELNGAPPQGPGLLRAIAKGVEAQGRLRVASGQIEPEHLRFHPPGVVGPLATAAACADLLGLSVEQTSNAIAIAASTGAGLIANIGSMTKALHCGNAAMRGLEAADLSAMGFSANPDPIGGPKGYGLTYFGSSFDPQPLMAPVKLARILDPGMAWKLFPAQYATHFVISAALDCRQAIADPAMIDSVSITTTPMGYVNRPAPDSGLAGKFSLQYVAAAALLDARVVLSTFTDARRFAPDMEAMLPRVTLHEDRSISGRLDSMHADVAVMLKDGRRIDRRCMTPEGSWSRPVPPQRIHEKARMLLGEFLPDSAHEAFWACVKGPASSLSVTRLMRTVSELR
jgi:2-methylcitrate dehydratase PrpD